MSSFYVVFFQEFEKEYHTLKSLNSDIVETTIQIITYLEKKIKELHKWLKNHLFENQEEEIYFFKELKPKLFSKLIYHKKILKIETNKPSSKKQACKFYEKELVNIFTYTKNNKNLYEYFRSKSSFNDADYFVRTPDKCYIQRDCSNLNYDESLFTSHDNKIAMIIANDLLTAFLEEKIEEANQSCNRIPSMINPHLNWTGNKVDLAELIYALHHQKVINGGNTDIKEIANYMGKMFNIEIEESIYRNYLDIKNRKSNRTKFLTNLSDNLNHKILNEEF